MRILQMESLAFVPVCRLGSVGNAKSRLLKPGQQHLVVDTAWLRGEVQIRVRVQPGPSSTSSTTASATTSWSWDWSTNRHSHHGWLRGTVQSDDVTWTWSALRWHSWGMRCRPTETESISDIQNISLLWFELYLEWSLPKPVHSRILLVDHCLSFGHFLKC